MLALVQGEELGGLLGGVGHEAPFQWAGVAVRDNAPAAHAREVLAAWDVRRPAYVLLVRPPATLRARAEELLGGKEHHPCT